MANRLRFDDLKLRIGSYRFNSSVIYSNRKCIHSEGGAHLFYANFAGLQRSLGGGGGDGGWGDILRLP